MKTIKVRAGQTIWDVCNEHYGSIQAMPLVLEDNEIALDQDLLPGQELKIRDPLPEVTENSRAIVQEIVSSGQQPNSGVVGVEIIDLYAEEDYVLEDYVE